MRTFKIILILLTLGLAVESSGQPFRDGPPFGGPRREQIRERINTIKIWKLTEDLNLSEKQSEKFFPIYNSFNADREKIEKQRQEIIRQLDDLTLAENPSETEITELINRFENLNQEMIARRNKFRNKLENVLTTRQIGRLIVFEIKFQRQIQDIIRDVKMEMRDRMNQGRGR